MSQPNFFQNNYPTSHFESPESYEDKAALTRRKNAESQKLYRERKKAQEAGLHQKVQTLQEKVTILEAQLAFERAQQSPFPPYLQTQHGYAPRTHSGGYSPEDTAKMLAALDHNLGKPAMIANSLFLQGR